MTTHWGRVRFGLVLGLFFFRAAVSSQLPLARQLAPVAGPWRLSAACPSAKGYYVTGRLADHRLLLGECDTNGAWRWWQTWGSATDSLRTTKLAALSPENIWVIGQHRDQVVVWNWKQGTSRRQVVEYTLGKGIAQNLTFTASRQILCALSSQTHIRLLCLSVSGKARWETRLPLSGHTLTDPVPLLPTRLNHIGVAHGNKLWMVHEDGRLIATKRVSQLSRINSLTELPGGNIIVVGSAKQPLLQSDNQDIGFAAWSPDGTRVSQNHSFGDEQVSELPLTVGKRPNGDLLLLSQTNESLREDIVTKNGDYYLHYQFNVPKTIIAQALPLAPWQGNLMLFLNQNNQVWLQTTRAYVPNQPDSLAQSTNRLRVTLNVSQTKQPLVLQAQDDQPLRYRVHSRSGQPLSCRLRNVIGTGYAFLFTRPNAKAPWQEAGWTHLDSLHSLIVPATQRPYELLFIISAGPSASPLQKAAPLVYQLRPNLSSEATLPYVSMSELAGWYKLPANQRLNLQTSLDGRIVVCDSFRGDAWFPIVVEVR